MLIITVHFQGRPVHDSIRMAIGHSIRVSILCWFVVAILFGGPIRRHAIHPVDSITSVHSIDAILFGDSVGLGDPVAVSVGLDAVGLDLAVEMGGFSVEGGLCLGGGSLLAVGVLVEVGEEEPEENRVESDPPHEASRVVAVSEEQLEGVHKDGDELNLKGKI